MEISMIDCALTLSFDHLKAHFDLNKKMHILTVKILSQGAV